MGRRRKKDGLAGNMDSLLDTLTSVVGILIIILIVIQIGVQEKVKELIFDNTDVVSESDVKKKNSEIIKLEKELKKNGR